MKKLFLFLIVTISVIIFSGCSRERLISKSALYMGTVVEITSTSQDAIKIVFDEFKRIEAILNYFDENSELSRLNRDGRIYASKELWRIINVANKISANSAGAFDITSAPAVDIWKKAIKENKLPSDLEIKRALSLIDWKNIYLNKKGDKRFIKFKKKNMKVDLGAIAKGFALDNAVYKLKVAGINNALINAGGDIYCLGTREGKFWQVGVENPRNKQDVVEVFSLADKAIATSGDYVQFFEVNSKRYSHIINPKTAYPADSKVISVTVVADSATLADALATAIFVLGEKQGLEVAKQFNINRVRVIKEGFLKDVYYKK